MLLELTRQPYTGHFLTFMLFDEAANVEGLDELLETALKNCFDVDIICGHFRPTLTHLHPSPS